MLNMLLNVSKLFILLATMVTILVIYKPVGTDIPVFISCHQVYLPSGIYQKQGPNNILPFKRGMDRLFPVPLSNNFLSAYSIGNHYLWQTVCNLSPNLFDPTVIRRNYRQNCPSGLSQFGENNNQRSLPFLNGTCYLFLHGDLLDDPIGLLYCKC